MNWAVAAAGVLNPPERIDRATWLKRNLPQLFPYEFGPHHKWLMNRPRSKPSGVRAFCAAPRGSGKTTVTHFGLPLECIAQGSHRFILIIKDGKEKAEAGLEMIRGELDRNEELTHDNPKLEYVTRKGKRTKDHAAEIELVGGRIMAMGAGQSVRGIVRRLPDGRVVRPDLILFDDLEDLDQVASTERTNKLEEWLFADVAGLAGPGKEYTMDVIGIGTTIGMDALAVRAIENEGRFAGWDTARFPAEYTDELGVRQPNWEGQPLSYLDQLTTSGHPLFIGSITYANEYLLDPQARGDTIFKKEWLQYGVAPPWDKLKHIALGIDPAASEKDQKKGDFSACVVTAIDEENRIWVVRAWKDRISMEPLFDRIEAQRAEIGEYQSQVAFEGVGGFAWGVQELRKRRIPHRPIKPQIDKVSRARPVSLLYEQRMVWHDVSLRSTDFERELLAFNTAKHDDQVDALVHAIKLTTNNITRIPKKAEAA